MSPEVGSFLAAAVGGAQEHHDRRGHQRGQDHAAARARQPDPGRTSASITVERALELGLDQFPELHPNVVAFEERLPNSEGQGAISMAELVRRSLRMNPSRVIVGEVLGDEIVTMLNAMTQGNDGSLSTIHANSSLEVFNRISTYAIQAAERLPIEATHMLIAGAIDFVVFQEKRNDYARGGALRRFVSSDPRGDRRGRPGAVERGVRGRPGRPGGAARAGLLPGGAQPSFGYDPRAGEAGMSAVRDRPRCSRSSSAALTGGGLFLAVVALYGAAAPGARAAVRAPGPAPPRAVLQPARRRRRA